MTSFSIKWFPPPTNQFKLNYDAIVHIASRKAAVGGALSGHIGSVLFSFVVDIGYCSVLAVKLWAIFLGLQLDKSHVFKEFIVESDSKSTIELIKECPDTHPCFMLIKNINEFELKGGVFVWSHMLQEGNPIVDKLVGFGLSVDVRCLIFDFVPSFLSNVVLADVSSTVFPHGF